MIEGLVKVLLALAPRAFRREKGEELLQVHRHRMMEARGPFRRWEVAIREVWGVLVLVVYLHRTRSSPRGALFSPRQVE